jgi:hypothetical protein
LAFAVTLKERIRRRTPVLPLTVTA